VNAGQRSKSRFFDRLAARWAGRGYDEDEVRRVDELMARSGIEPGMRILEPGCGPGLITRQLAELVGPSGFVLALDLSPQMVQQCRRRTRLYPQVSVEWGALEELCGHRGEFSLVFCCNSFPHFSDRRKALRVVADCLVRDGRLVIAHSNSRQRVNEIHRCAGGAVKHDLLPEPATLCALVESQGFAVTELDDGPASFFLAAVKRQSAPLPPMI